MHSSIPLNAISSAATGKVNLHLIHQKDVGRSPKAKTEVAKEGKKKCWKKNQAKFLIDLKITGMA
jgi:hypothetical protein